MTLLELEGCAPAVIFNQNPILHIIQPMKFFRKKNKKTITIIIMWSTKRWQDTVRIQLNTRTYSSSVFKDTFLK